MPPRVSQRPEMCLLVVFPQGLGTLLVSMLTALPLISLATSVVFSLYSTGVGVLVFPY